MKSWRRVGLVMRIMRLWLITIPVVILIHAAHGAVLSQGHPLREKGSPVSALSFSQDGRLLASGSLDGVVSVWTVVPGRLMRTFAAHNSKVAAVAFSSNGRLLVSGGKDSLHVWTVEGQAVRELRGQTNGISALAFCSDGWTLVSGGTGGELLLWNTQDWTLRRRLVGHPSCIHALRVSSNNQFLASGSDEFLRIWDLKEAAPFDTLRTWGEPVRAVSYYDLDVSSAGDAKPKFETSGGKSLQLWQPSGVIGTHILGPWSSHIGCTFSESKAHPNAVAAEDGLMATGWTNGIVQIRDINGYGRVSLDAHTTAVQSVTFSARGTHMATGSEDGMIRLWPARQIMDKANSEASRKRELGKHGE